MLTIDNLVEAYDCKKRLPHSRYSFCCVYRQIRPLYIFLVNNRNHVYTDFSILFYSFVLTCLSISLSHSLYISPSLQFPSSFLSVSSSLSLDIFISLFLFYFLSLSPSIVQTPSSLIFFLHFLISFCHYFIFLFTLFLSQHTFINISISSFSFLSHTHSTNNLIINDQNKTTAEAHKSPIAQKARQILVKSLTKIILFPCFVMLRVKAIKIKSKYHANIS